MEAACLAVCWSIAALAAEPSPPPEGEADRSAAAALAELEKLARPPVWSTAGSVRAGGGYRDNVRLSAFNPVAAGFAGVGGDFTLQRLPVDGTEVTLFATGDYLAFVDEPAAEPEALVMTQAEIKRDLGRSWNAGLRAQYVFLNQVFDVSATEAEPFTVLARGHLISATPMLSRALAPNWTAEAACEGSRQIFEAPLDPYWTLAPGGTLTRSLGRRGEVALTYRHERRWYDERPPLAADGAALLGRLQFESHEVEFRPRLFWDVARHWSTRLRLGALLNRDNGGGYFDYTRYTAALQVRYRAARWMVQAELRGLRYDYDTRRVAEVFSPLRRKTDWSLRLRGEWQVSRRWTLFAQWDREGSDDRLPAADYLANTVQLGWEWEL
jgi:hypothetical protein